jgi:mevalonate kinase
MPSSDPAGRVTEATAPGKIILFGEHAVVYGRPAIAAPLGQVRARAVVADSPEAGVLLVASDVGRRTWLAEAPEDDPFARAVRVTAAAAGRPDLAHLTITVQSAIPIASGLGSGAAMAAAVIRALAAHLGAAELAADERISALTYQVERLLHGTPSGIDNTVVAYERPVYFIRRPEGNIIEPLRVGAPLRLLVADTGRASVTRRVVADVRRRWEAQPARFEALFDACGRVAEAARRAMEAGDAALLGRLMDENQAYLAEMTVSSPALERLIAGARAAGAWGAKLSGAGRGGNMIALVSEEGEAAVKAALLARGARAVLGSVLS